MIRAAIYYFDRGTFYYGFIGMISQAEYLEIQASKYRRALVLGEDDWYGEKAPSIWAGN